MQKSRSLSRTPAAVLIALGMIAMLAGFLVLTALGLGLYSEPWSRFLADIGIPMVMVSEFVSLAGVFGGAALIAAAVAAARRQRN